MLLVLRRPNLTSESSNIKSFRSFLQSHPVLVSLFFYFSGIHIAGQSRPERPAGDSKIF